MSNRTPFRLMLCSQRRGSYEIRLPIIFPPSTHTSPAIQKRQRDMDTADQQSRVWIGPGLDWWKNTNARPVFAWNYDSDFMAARPRSMRTMAVADTMSCPAEFFHLRPQFASITPTDNDDFINSCRPYSTTADYSWIQPMKAAHGHILYPFATSKRECAISMPRTGLGARLVSLPQSCPVAAARYWRISRLRCRGRDTSIVSMSAMGWIHYSRAGLSNRRRP